MKSRDKKNKQGQRQSWDESPVERRKWRRYPPVEGTLAMVAGRPYRLLDISRGGLAIYDYGEQNVPDKAMLSLHTADKGLTLDTLQCRKVSYNRVVSYSTYSAEVIHRISLEIVEADPDMGSRLEPFMSRS